MPEIELVCDDNNLCGEGPLWDAARGRLIWNDCASSLLYEHMPETGRRRVISSGLMIACAALNRDGRLVVAGSGGLHLWSRQDEFVTMLSEHGGEPLIFNDMIAEPTGGIYAGTIYWDAHGMIRPGKLYHIVADAGGRAGARAQVVDDAIPFANGLAFSPDDRTLYFTDSAARTIYAYDMTPGDPELRRKRVFVRVGDDEGIPDGLTVDVDGFVYSAQWYGGQVVRYDPQGRIERRIRLPVTQVSSLAFGGADLRDLYITTAAEPWPSSLAPSGYDFKAGNTGGGLYRVRMETPGRHEHFAAFG